MPRNSSKNLKWLHSALQIHRSRTRKFPNILDLAEKVLYNICRCLPLVDQVCLSLTCKKLYWMFGTIGKHEDLAFPRLLAIRIPILCVNSPDVVRNRLLRRLENRHWAYCAECLKLHPRKEFGRGSLRHSAWRRACTDHAGIVDICPCISLTVRDREKIFERLKSPVKPAKIEFGAFRFFFVNGNSSLGHSCTKSGSSRGDVRVIVHLRINPSGELEAVLNYTLRDCSLDAHLLAEPIFACPHQDLQSLACTDKATKICQRCETFIFKSVAPEEDAITFEVLRRLGSSPWPADAVWMNQCRLNGHWFSHYELYWWRSQELHKSLEGEIGQWERNYCLKQRALFQKSLVQKKRQYAQSLLLPVIGLLPLFSVV